MNNNIFKFKKDHTFEERLNESTRICKKYSNRIPIICEKSLKSKVSEIDKNKFLVPENLTIGQFAYVIRKRLKIKAEEAIFILINNVFYSTSSELGDIYQEHKDDDGFLYINYSSEDTFG